MATSAGCPDLWCPLGNIVNIRGYLLLMHELRTYISKILLESDGKMGESINVPRLKGWTIQRYEYNTANKVQKYSDDAHDSFWYIRKDMNMLAVIYDSGHLVLYGMIGVGPDGVENNNEHLQRPDLANNPIQAARYVYLTTQATKSLAKQPSSKPAIKETKHSLDERQYMFRGSYPEEPEPYDTIVFPEIDNWRAVKRSIGIWQIYPHRWNDYAATYTSDNFDCNEGNVKFMGVVKEVSSLEQAVRYVWLKMQTPTSSKPVVKEMDEIINEPSVPLTLTPADMTAEGRFGQRLIKHIFYDVMPDYPKGGDRVIFNDLDKWSADMDSQARWFIHNGKREWQRAIYDNVSKKLETGVHTPDSVIKDMDNLHQAVRYVWLKNQKPLSEVRYNSYGEEIPTSPRIFDGVIPKRPKNEDVVVFKDLDDWEAVYYAQWGTWQINDSQGNWRSGTYNYNGIKGDLRYSHGTDRIIRQIPNLKQAVRYIWLKEQKPKTKSSKPAITDFKEGQINHSRTGNFQS